SDRPWPPELDRVKACLLSSLRALQQGQLSEQDRKVDVVWQIHLGSDSVIRNASCNKENSRLARFEASTAVGARVSPPSRTPARSRSRQSCPPARPVRIAVARHRICWSRMPDLQSQRGSPQFPHRGCDGPGQLSPS